jgi:hypothetical protein
MVSQGRPERQSDYSRIPSHRPLVIDNGAYFCRVGQVPLSLHFFFARCYNSRLFEHSVIFWSSYFLLLVAFGLVLVLFFFVVIDLFSFRMRL